jgi:hypothetical protein
MRGRKSYFSPQFQSIALGSIDSGPTVKQNMITVEVEVSTSWWTGSRKRNRKGP